MPRVRRALIAVLAVVAVGATLADSPAHARAPKDAVFAGSTSQDFSVVVQTSRTGRTIKLLRIHWTDSCRRNREKFTEFDSSDRIRVRSDGTFSKRARYREAGTGRRVRVRIAGTVRSQKARGRFRARARTGSGRRCSTGRVRWRAPRIALP